METQGKKSDNMNGVLLSGILDRPIAFHRSFVGISGITGAVMLSQAVYWSRRTADPEGWFHKSIDDWEGETGLTRFEQETAKRNLKGILLTERRGCPAKLYFRIDWDALEKSLFNASMLKSSKQDCGNPANIHTEITTEITKTELTETKKTDKQADCIQADRKSSPANGLSVSQSFCSEVGEVPDELSRSLLSAGFSKNDAMRILKNYPVDRITLALEYAKEKKPGNIQGFVFKALSEDWSLPFKSPASEKKDPYRADLKVWKETPYELKRKYLAMGGFGTNSDYPEPGWLRKVLEKIGSTN